MRIDRPAVTPDTFNAKVGRYHSLNTSRGYNTLGEGLWDTFTGALTNVLKTGLTTVEKLAPQIIMQKSGAADQVNALLSKLTEYRTTVHGRVLSIQSKMNMMLPPMRLSSDPNIRQVASNLGQEGTTLYNKGVTYYNLIIKSETALRDLVNSIIVNPSVVTSSLTTINSLLSEAGSLSVQGYDFINAADAYLKRFDTERNAAYGTTTTSAAKEVWGETMTEIEEKARQAKAVLTSPWLIPGILVGLVALIGLRSRR
jgi:hypothetical protein